jgi:hypothetical protein
MSFKEIIDKYEQNMKVYKNEFSTYQDMIDGQFIIEDYDNDNEEERYSEVNDDDDNNDEDDIESLPELIERELEDEVMSEISEEDLNTISVIEEVFKYSKKISNSNKELKKELEELRDVVNDMGILIKCSIIFFGFVLVFCQENVCKPVNI